MKKYQNATNFIVIILFNIIWTFSSCNQPDKKNEGNEIKVLKEISVADTNRNSEQIRKRLKANGIYSYFKQDTFYIYDRNESLIIKRYLSTPRNYPNFNKVVETNYWIEQTKKEGYLFVSLYVGDATPYKSYLIDLQTNQLIVENENYQTYIGSSSNKLYHLFEGGTSASLRDFAIFSSENKLLKSSGYYSSMNDKNQLKWIGNKIYYYNNCKQGTILPHNLPELKEQEIYVQKYYWTNYKDSITNDFSVVFVE